MIVAMAATTVNGSVREESRERERHKHDERDRRREEDKAMEDALRDFVRDVSDGQTRLGRRLFKSRLGGHH